MTDYDKRYCRRINNRLNCLGAGGPASQGYSLYLDNLYPSVGVVERLCEMIHVVGTETHREGIPGML